MIFLLALSPQLPAPRDRDIELENQRCVAAEITYKCQYRPCRYQSKRESNRKWHMEIAYGWTYVRSKDKSRQGPSPNHRPPRGAESQLRSPLSGATHSYFENAKAIKVEIPFHELMQAAFSTRGRFPIVAEEQDLDAAGILGEVAKEQHHEEDLSNKPRCRPCSKSQKGCDRQRPCQRCKDAGLGLDQCTSEDEGNDRKGRFGRHMGVTVN